MRWVVIPLAVVTATTAVGCGHVLGLGDSCSVDSDERPVRVLSDPQLRPAPLKDANVVLDVMSNLEEPVRVTVDLGGRTALDAEVPGTGADCSHSPVHRYPYDLPRERVRVTASTDQGHSDSRSVVLGAERRWLVVQVQDGFPLSLRVYDERPAYG